MQRSHIPPPTTSRSQLGTRRNAAAMSPSCGPRGYCHHTSPQMSVGRPGPNFSRHQVLLDPYNPVQEQPFDEDQPQAKSTIAAAKESFNVVTAPTASLLISDENCGEIQKVDEEDPGAIERYRDVVMNGRLDPAMMYHMDIDSQLQYMTHLQQLLTKNETDSKNLLLPRLLVSNRQFRLPKCVSDTVLQVA